MCKLLSHALASRIQRFGMGVLACGILAHAQQNNQEKQSTLLRLDQISESIQALAYKVTPSVVRISATGYELRSEGNRADYSAGRKESIGSGMIVDPAGYIMTNAHVVEGAHTITVTRVPVAQR